MSRSALRSADFALRLSLVLGALAGLLLLVKTRLIYLPSRAHAVTPGRERPPGSARAA